MLARSSFLCLNIFFLPGWDFETSPHTHTKKTGKLTLEQIAKKAAEQGYAGIECSVRLAAELDENDGEDAASTSTSTKAPVAGAGKGLFASTLGRHGLSWCPVVLSSGPVWRGFDPFVDLAAERASRASSQVASSPAQHATALAGQLDAALALASAPGGGGLLDELFLPAPSAPRGEAVALVGSDAMGTPWPRSTPAPRRPGPDGSRSPSRRTAGGSSATRGTRST